MFFLRNDALRVEVLDPALDRDRMGSRYCAGGYIWGASDTQGRPLFSGPFFPDATTPFDGQGAPEVFETALGADVAKVGDLVCVPGVGLVRRDSRTAPFHVRDNPAVVRFADWDVEESTSETVRMRTTQEFKGTRLDLARTVKIMGVTLESRTELGYAGEHPLSLRWFAHPFFPPQEKLCRFTPRAKVPENPAFGLDPDDFLVRDPGYKWEKGFYQPLEAALGKPLRVEQLHAVAETIRVECDWPLAWLPVWGNARAFSFEPYHDVVLEPGTATAWTIRYAFGDG